MKKLLVLVILLLCISFLFAETEVLSVGSTSYLLRTSHLSLPDLGEHNVDIVEIRPENEKVCKVVFKNGYTEYLKIGDVITRKKTSTSDVHKLKVISFDYNEIKLEVIKSDDNK